MIYTDNQPIISGINIYMYIRLHRVFFLFVGLSYFFRWYPLNIFSTCRHENKPLWFSFD